MSYSFSILTSSGYPFYTKKVQQEPDKVSLNMRFYDFVHEVFSTCERADQTFELQAGLVSALYEFARVLGYPIEFLKFNTTNENSTLFRNLSSHSLVPVQIPDDSDVLITSRTEIFLIPENFEAKINLIFKNIISHHLPLGPEKRITDADEEFIVNLLSDSQAIEKLNQNQSELDKVCENIISEYQSYGLEGLIIASFDGNPLKTYNISKANTSDIFRNLGTIPIVKEYQWKYRLTHQRGLYIINSGTGINIEEIFMPYYYILITSVEAFLGDSPTSIYQKINEILID